MSKGFLVYAKGKEYVEQAYLLALSIKATGNSYPVSIVTDDKITKKTAKVFDKIIPVPWNENEDTTRYQTLSRWKLYHVSPYTQTIVLDTDILVLQNIDEWWSFLSKYKLFFVSKAFTYRNEVIDNDYYRKAFTANLLPNIYSGFHYFEKSDYAHSFFKWTEIVNYNWELFYGHFCQEFYPHAPSMDITNAIVSKILDIDQEVINVKINFLHFVHMKPQIQNWLLPLPDWENKVGIYLTKSLDLIIGNFKQHGIFHYASSKFVTNDIIKSYEDCVL